jgi:transposase
VCDRFGRALGFRLLPGQANELRAAEALLAVAVSLGAVLRVVCDRGYSSRAWREAIAATGAEPVVPAQPTHPVVAYDRAAYRRRHHVEQAWGRLKEWRAVATRYEKTADSFAGVLYVASALDWIKHGKT